MPYVNSKSADCSGLPMSARKKGGSAFDIFLFPLILVFQNCNLYHLLNSKKQDTVFSRKTHYHFLNSPHYNWKRFLTLLAVRVTDYFNSLTKKQGYFTGAG